MYVCSMLFKYFAMKVQSKFCNSPSTKADDVIKEKESFPGRYMLNNYILHPKK